jgi:hypothetical protein
VLKNQDIGRNWNIAFSATKPMWHGLSRRTAYSYGRSQEHHRPGFNRRRSWNSNPTPAIRTTRPRLLERVDPATLLASSSYTKQYFGFGATTSRVLGNAHARQHQLHLRRRRQRRRLANDLIYIPRNTRR